MSKKPTILSDKQEDAGGPHWLSPEGRRNPNAREEIRKKHRDKYLAEQNAKRNGEKHDG